MDGDAILALKAAFFVVFFPSDAVLFYNKQDTFNDFVYPISLKIGTVLSGRAEDNKYESFFGYPDV